MELLPSWERHSELAVEREVLAVGDFAERMAMSSHGLRDVTRLPRSDYNSAMSPPLGVPEIVPAPFDAYRAVVRPDWIDHNYHMNMGYYLVVFDLATDEFLRWIGLDEAHRRQHRVSTFCLEAHITYHREVREGDPLRFTTQLLAYDAKRIHFVHAMYHASEGYLASVNELMSLHVSQDTRRATTMTPAILERLARIREAHAALPQPSQVGRVIGLDVAPTTR